MQTEEIARLLAPFLDRPLSTSQLGLVSSHLDLLLRWNERVNLTAVRRPEEIISRHFGESFFAARQLFPPDWRGHAVDLGSGAGFPGVPIAIYAPGAEVTLIESNHKKATFLRELTRALKLSRVQVFAGRAEDLAATRKVAPPDVVTLRAVEKFEAAVPVAASLLAGPAVGTIGDVRRLALLIGLGQVERAKSLVEGFVWEKTVPTPESANRVLLVGNLSSKESTM